MPTIRVGSYSLAIASYVNQKSSTPVASRAIFIKPHASYKGTVQFIYLFFFAQTKGNLSVTSTDTNVYAHLDEKDFKDIYHVLQTESPTYFDWEDGLRFRITTDEEPPGEGFKDTSG
jgi:hypothetical protein